ncbi:hypothetical protein TRFO_32213 [Tritrichomonas foetus]|uniref:Uncharacterized protein n=1 Tax=Tritrichomonas foetus TaxID=1144522 RepID=A0A1J4JRA4_9EUKA|nr:hypothetical protein TRFO_32213 [Tritrichomonas foetus]|eukprot:OHT00952.1 hypothetical protein TRFO_32213 [Tritrichomonas foetus]
MTSHSFNAGDHSFYGAFDLELLSGKITFFGASFNQGFKDKIFAPFHQLPLVIHSEDQFEINFTSLEEKDFDPCEYRFYDYCPETYTEIMPRVYYKEGMHGASYEKETIDKIDEIVKGSPKKIYLFGPKSFGKSTMSRFLVNKIKSATHEQPRKVIFVDLDPGQSEISLPSILSCKIDCPFLLNPSEHNSIIADFLCPNFSLSINDTETHFMKSSKEIAKKISKWQNEYFIVINSHGWVEKQGYENHVKLIDTFRPDIIFVLHRKNNDPIEINGEKYKIPNRVNVPITPIKGEMSSDPKILREIRFTGYFLRNNRSISTQMPQEVPIRNVRFTFTFNINDMKSQIAKILNGSLVLLCNDNFVYKPSNNLLFTLVNPHYMKCVGFGFVRFVDVKNEKLYIVTPVDMKRVNTIVHQGLRPPSVLFRDSERFQVTYSFIDVVNS